MTEITIASSNSKALNAIFSAVDEKVFQLISQCDIAKDAWNILQKAFAPNWSESDSNQSQEEEEETSNFIALTGRVPEFKIVGCSSNVSTNYDSGSDEDDITNESIIQKYQLMLDKWKEVVEINRSLDKHMTQLLAEKIQLEHTINVLLTEKEELKMSKEESQNTIDVLVTGKAELSDLVSSLKIQAEKNKEMLDETVDELNKLRATVKQFNAGSRNLDTILMSQRLGGSREGIGYHGTSSAKGSQLFQQSRQLNHQEQVYRPRGKYQQSRDKVKLIRKGKQPMMRKGEDHICYFCNQRGHIKTRCPLFLEQIRIKKKNRYAQIQYESRVKRPVDVCHVAYSSSESRESLQLQALIAPRRSLFFLLSKFPCFLLS